MTKVGTYVHVRNGTKQKWTKALFLTHLQSLNKPYITVALGDEERWRKGGKDGKVSLTQWQEMEEIKELPEVTTTFSEIALLKKCEQSQIAIMFNGNKIKWDSVRGFITSPIGMNIWSVLKI